MKVEKNHSAFFTSNRETNGKDSDFVTLLLDYDGNILTLQSPGEEAVCFDDMSISRARELVKLISDTIDFAEKELNNPVIEEEK